MNSACGFDGTYVQIEEQGYAQGPNPGFQEDQLGYSGDGRGEGGCAGHEDDGNGWQQLRQRVCTLKHAGFATYGTMSDRCHMQDNIQCREIMEC